MINFRPTDLGSTSVCSPAIFRADACINKFASVGCAHRGSSQISQLAICRLPLAACIRPYGLFCNAK